VRVCLFGYVCVCCANVCERGCMAPAFYFNRTFSKRLQDTTVVYVYVYVFVYIYVYVFACMCVCACGDSILIQSNSFKDNTRCVHVCVYLLMFVCMCVCSDGVQIRLNLFKETAKY